MSLSINQPLGVALLCAAVFRVIARVRKKSCQLRMVCIHVNMLRITLRTNVLAGLCVCYSQPHPINQCEITLASARLLCASYQTVGIIPANVLRHNRLLACSFPCGICDRARVDSLYARPILRDSAARNRRSQGWLMVRGRGPASYF